MLFLIVQALRNVVNRSGQIAQNIFDQLDRRLKSADKKKQSGDRGQGVRGQGVGGGEAGGQEVGSEGVKIMGESSDQKKQKTGKNAPPDNQTHAHSLTVSLLKTECAFINKPFFNFCVHCLGQTNNINFEFID